MNIPKYVVKTLSRSRYNYEDQNDSGYAVGYTINIRKETPYTKIQTFYDEINRLINWVKKEYNKLGGTNEYGEVACVLYVPDRTKYCNQYATVTIFDPIMKYLEQYINNW